MPLPLIVNKIRTDGPHEALGNSFGQVRSGGTKWHKGWDLSADVNSPVFALGAGTVVQSHANVSGFGRCVLVEIDNPKYLPETNKSVGITGFKHLYALYAHLSHTDVKVGDVVDSGDQLGKTGTTGNAGGEPPHLHLELLLENSLAKKTPRVDPGELLGYEMYTCGDTGIVNQAVFGSCEPE